MTRQFFAGFIFTIPVVNFTSRRFSMKTKGVAIAALLNTKLKNKQKLLFNAIVESVSISQEDTQIL